MADGGDEEDWKKNAMAAIEQEIGRKLTDADLRYISLDFKNKRRRYFGPLVYELVKRKADQMNRPFPR
jgi:hypothetical protein